MATKSTPSDPTTLDILPDEIIILILSECVIDLKTLTSLMSVSSRLRCLSIHVLAHYRLPATSLLITIDQEGKSKVTTQFEFSHFCPESFNTLYTSNHPTARRYYIEKAYPVVRSMSIKGTCLVQPLSASSSTTFVGSDRPLLAKQPSCTTKLSDPALVYHYGNPKKLSAQEEGFHILQVSPYSTNHGSFWKLAYRVTNKHKPEYYLTPVNISIGFKHLLKLNALNSGDFNIEKAPFKKTLNKVMSWVS
ncbi:hypothetical protein [Parasitella parasitica]|uniref:F-box domain-containing protein n=1 Tax=Parasitella parasitica TaxID=35722 RepID=A0A0B7NAY3_9FUNG|nr:hypothetical protein [Parasitella parasitica]